MTDQTNPDPMTDEQAAALLAPLEEKARALRAARDAKLRAAVLREAADALTAKACQLSEQAEEEMRSDLEDQAQVWHEAAAAVRRLINRPSRMADETATTETTADKAARLGMTPEEYRAHRHLAAVRQIRAALPGLYATTGLRIEAALAEPAAGARQDGAQA